MGAPGGFVDHPAPLDELVAVALGRCYEAMASLRVGPAMRVRRADVTPLDVAALAAPIRTVEAAALDRWLPHAVTTWGTADDLRALLPRALEAFALGQLATAPEVLFAQVRRAAPERWPAAQQAALDDVVSATWLATLASPRPRCGHPAWRLLVALAELGGELSPYLDDWLLMLTSAAPERASAQAHLTALATVAEGRRAAGGDVGDLFWRARPSEATRLSTWLASPFTQAELPSSEVDGAGHPSAPAARSAATWSSS